MVNFFKFFRGKKVSPRTRDASVIPGIQLLEDRSVPTVINFTGPTNINPLGASNPDQYTQVNSTLYFTANETDSVRGVYRYNNSVNPSRVTAGAGQPALVNPTGMTSAGDRLFFGAQNSQDSTQGLYAVVAPNSTTLKVLNTPVFITPEQVAFGQNTYFLGSPGPGVNNTLYRTLDTYNSNGVLSSIRSLPVPSNVNPAAVWNNPQKLYIDGPFLYMVDKNAQGSLGLFQISLSSNQTELYAEFGVKQVVGYNYSSISDFNIVNGTVYFQGVAATGTKPQVVSVARSASSALTLTQPLNGVDPNLLQVDLVGPMRFVNSQVFFGGKGSDQTTQLYTSNGTVAGTKKALVINPTGNGLDPVNGLLNSVSVPNALILAANGGTFQTTSGSGPEVFVQYGMEPASIPVALDGSLNSKNPINFIDLNPGTDGSNPTNFAANNYQVYFAANDRALGNELFTTQGAIGNTFQLKDFNPTGSSSPKNLAVRDGILYLAANNGTSGAELYAGTTFETRTTSEISSNSPTNGSLVNVGGNLFYTVASDLFVSDGTTNGTRAVTTSSGAAGIVVASMRSFNGALYFLRANASNGLDLWFSRASTTTPIQQVNLSPVVQFSASAQVVSVTDNYLYIADNRNLYQVDTAGNIALKASNFVFSNPTSTGSVAGRSLTNANGTLFFAGLESAGNFALYRLAPSDTVAKKVADFTFQTGHSQPINFGSIYGRAFFTALDGFTGNSLFYSEGIPLNVKPTADSVYVRSLDASTTLDTYSNRIFFGSPTDTSVGNEPWITDGLLAGTKNTININLNGNGQAPSNPSGVVSNGRFGLFSAGDQGTGSTGIGNFQPYIISGYDKPVVSLLSAINTQSINGSLPGDFLPVGTQMFFTADIGTSGITNRVLYSTQGTAATTNRVVTAAGTPVNVDNLVNMQGNVAFRATSATVGSSVVWNSAVDPLALPVKSILRASPASIRVDAPPTTQVVFRVTFNFDVDPTSVDASDFVIVNDSTLTKPSITSVTQANPTDLRSYLVTLSIAQNVNSFGKLTINTSPKAVVKAVAVGNPQVDLGLPVRNPEAYEVNPKAPIVNSINRFNPPGVNSNGGTVTYQVNFSQDIIPTTVNASDFSVTTTGSVTVPVTFIGNITPVPNNPRSFFVEVIGIAGQGSIRLNVVPNATILSTAGIPYSQGGFTGGEFYTIDTLVPGMTQVLQQNPISGTNPINNQVVTFQTVFNEPINPATVDPTDFVGSLFGSSVISTTMVDSKTWNVSVAVPNSQGTLALQLSPSVNIRDVAGNLIDPNVVPNPNQSYIVNRLAPTVSSINRFDPANQSTAASQVVFQVAFSTNMDAATIVPGAFQLNTTGTVSGSILSVSPVSGSPNLFQVTVGKFGGSGNINLFVNPNSGMKDSTGNSMFEGFASNNPNNQVYTIQDLSPPNFTGMVVVPNSDPSVTLVNVNFSEAVTGLTDAAFSAVTNNGAILQAVLNPTPQPGQYLSTYQVKVTGYQGGGTLTLSFTNTGGIQDLANIPLNAPVGEVVGTISSNYAVRGPKPIVTSAGVPGTPAVVQINYSNGTVTSFTAFNNFLGGVRTTTGDVNGDGVEDIVVAAQLGGRSHIRVFDGKTLAPIRDFYPFDGYNGGVSVSAADITNDGVADIIAGVTSAYPNQPAFAPSHVMAFNGKSGKVVASYYAYNVNFTGGVNVAGGDVNGDGFGDIITSPSFGATAHIKVFSGKTQKFIQSYYAFGVNYMGGAFITAADFNNDGFADVAVGANIGTPYVTVISGKNPNTTLDSFFPFNPQRPTGVRVGYMVTTQGLPRLVIMPGYNSSPLVQLMTYSEQGFFVDQQFIAGFNSKNQGGMPG